MACFSLAGTIVQFVDFTCKIISKTHTFSNDSRISIHEQAENAANDLLDLSSKFQLWNIQDTTTIRLEADEVILKSLCRDCEKVAKELLEKLQRIGEDKVILKSLCHDCEKVAKELLEKLQRVGEMRKGQTWKNLQHAMLSVWSAKDIEEVERRLSGYRQAINTRVLTSLRYVIYLLPVTTWKTIQLIQLLL
jgi:hypothetical protein